MTDVIDDFLDGKPVGAPKRYKPNLTADDARALATTAQELGIDPVDLATVISYETGGTFNPDQRGPTTKWGQHRGLIQFGEPQRQKYGVRDGMSFAEQLPAVSAYLRDSGVKPGMGILDVYSAVNAGGPGRYNASDAAAGGAPGTVADKVNNQMGAHRKRAESWLGMIGIGSAGAAERGSAADIDAFLDAPGAAAPATPAPTGEMRAYEPTFFDAISGAFDTLVGNHDGSFKRPLIARVTDAAGQVVDAITPDALQRGWESEKRNIGRTLPNIPTVMGPEYDRLLQDIEDANAQKRIELYGPSAKDEATMQRMSGAQSLGDWASAVADNPFIIPNIILESVGQHAIPLALNEISRVIGIPAMGASSFNTERLSAIDDMMQKAGVDLTDPVAVSRFRANNQEAVAAAEKRGMTRGAVIATIDALITGVAGRASRGTGIGQAAARTATDAAIGMIGGIAGELGAQKAADGQITSLGDALTEGIVEGPTAVLEGISNVSHARANAEAMARANAEAAARADAAPTSEIAPETLRAGNERLAQAQAVDSFLDEPAAPAQQAEPAPTAEPQAQPQPQTSEDGQQPASGPDVATQGEQPGQADPAEATTTNAPAQPAETPAAAAPEPATATPPGQADPAPAGAPVEPAPQRARFASPDDVAAQEFVQRAVAEGVPEETARKLAAPAPRDEVTGYYDGRAQGVKAGTVERAQEHVRSTGESAFYVDGDIVNLGGLNKAAKEDMTVANKHYRAMSDILRTELESIGADVVPMRTGGDELGAVVVNAGEGAVRAAMQAADAKIRAYAAQNGLDTIPHTKQGRTEVGVGLHLGMAPIVPGVPVSDIFSRASIDVNQSKEAGYVARTTTEGAGAGAPGEQTGATARSASSEGQGAGQQAVATAERAQVETASSEARAQDGVAPLLEQANDRPDVPARPEAAPQGSGNAASREAAQLEVGGQGPEQSTRRGKGRDEFTQASFTNRRSWKQDAFRAAGLNPDEAELLPVGKQFEAVARALKDKFGITAQMGNKAIGRMALDQVLDLYRNAQTMAHVLGLPEKAIGLGDSLTLLLRGDAPYLGAMYPGGGKVEGVDLPAGAIALPRRSNSFAHEWGHALDLFLTSKFGFPADGNLLTRKIRSEGIDFQPQSAQEAFVRLLDNLFYDQAELAAKVMALQQAANNGTPAQQAKAKAQLEKLMRGNSRLKIDGSQYKIASREYGNEVSGEAGGEYFADPAELLARAFEAYTAARVEAAGGSVEVLAKGDSAYLSDSDERFAKTFPKLEERLRIFAAFDDLFAQLAKEQLIAQGVAASNPGNLDSFDPRKWLQDAPAKESAGIMGVIREQAEEINAWRERNKREAARPQDPMAKAKRLQNSLMAWSTPLQGVFRIMEKRYPQSKAMRELANKLTTAPGNDRLVGRVLEQAIRITGGRNYNQFGNIIDRYRLDKLDSAGRSELRGLLVSASDPASSRPELVKAAAELRRFMDTLWYDNQEADINIGYTKNGYLPRVIDMAAVQADATGFIEAATEAYKVQLQSEPDIDPASIDERAEAMARAWHANIVSAPPVNFSSAHPVENYTKHRSLPQEADTILERFYVNDPLELIHQYIGRSARATEFAKAFGPKGEQLNALFRQMSAEGVLLEDQRYLQGSVSSLLGRQSAGWLDGKPRAQALMNQVNAYGVMSMLGRVLISSIAEPGMAGLRTGSAANVFRPYYNLFKQTIGTADSKAWREITRAIGLIGDAQADAVVQARLGGTFESTPKTDARLARYFAITGLHALTNAQRVSLMPVAHRYLAVMAYDAVNGSPAAKRFAAAELRELGISDFQGFSEWIGDVDRPTIDMLFDANGRETEQGSAYMTAMSRVNEQIVQAPYRFDRPEAANSPGGRFLYGIMSFNMAFWNNVYKRQANVIAREYGKGGVSGAANVASYVAGNLAPPMIAYFMTQLLVTIAREAMLNPKRWEEWDKDGTLNENLFMLTLSRAFPMGMFDPLIQAYQGLKYQRDLTGVAVGAVPSYFLGAAQKIANAFTDANSPNTNNAEFSAMQGGYQLVANPLIAHVATSIPGGPILTPLAGAAVAIGTSAAARDAAATAVVGEKDSLVAKRRAAAKREQKALQSGGGSVRNGDRQSNREKSSREKSNRGGTR